MVQRILFVDGGIVGGRGLSGDRLENRERKRDPLVLLFSLLVILSANRRSFGICYVTKN